MEAVLLQAPISLSAIRTLMFEVQKNQLERTPATIHGHIGGFKGRGKGPCPPNLAATSSRRGHLAPPGCKKTFQWLGLRPGPRCESLQRSPRSPIADGEGIAAPPYPQEPHSRCRPLGPSALALLASPPRAENRRLGPSSPNMTGQIRLWTVIMSVQLHMSNTCT